MANRTAWIAVAANIIAAPMLTWLMKPEAAAAQAQIEQAAMEPWAEKLLAAAHAQVGETVMYDPAYMNIAYPGGDVPRDRGVCTDVIVRAYRDAFGIDLQQLVHEDMRANFAAYPTTWGLAKPDANIDHRRVPNLETFFARSKAGLALSKSAADFRPGDIVSQRLPGGLPHIGIVSDRRSRDRSRPLLVHNIGAGARVEDVLMAFTIVGHYRFRPQA
jgi:uncharacterized protein YijF (DUF1287 family)